MEELVSAYRAMEAPSVIVSLARGFGGGCLSEQVQQVFMDRCVKDEICRIFPPSSSYIRNCLKQFILAVEAESSCALDSLYDEHAALLLRIEDGNSMAYKTFSYAVPGEDKRSGTVTLRLSLNMLEGGTGCFCWPAGVYLAELVLSYPWLIKGKRCLELGSGAGLVGVCLARQQPFELVLTDGDLSTFANLRHNLEINGIVLDTDEQEKVKCRRLEWEDACSTELYKADIILGADIIYDTACIPHLVKVLALLLQADAGTEAILATVKRNPVTISSFCDAATQAGLEVSDVSRTMVPLKCFQGLVSFDNSDMLLHKVVAKPV
ncbi:protein-lysine N-methyltransferase EEF2KMT isoform X1 [Selaginella moellendorffii]|uniref:protein-lysine N-methyltransferase EEF2KMT isoform X1 n=1 Tax=Selaginella moellendorffii TaxID=88036 RepID=UPI000D1C678B|nr:protein-lysine N-methyltransferase EEF2KMT isoform X1 [Selaginella moellendorffii]|eukprot:XP_024519201.1 protein-lysine N-methyltransferase EEF2KMT isoform X1 [Selaginella moellendorffii]